MLSAAPRWSEREAAQGAIMNPKLIVAILVIAAMPVCAQAQNPSASTLASKEYSKSTVFTGEHATGFDRFPIPAIKAKNPVGF
jgi:hypothetical protein